MTDRFLKEGVMDRQTNALVEALNELASAIRENTQAVAYLAAVNEGEPVEDAPDAPIGYDLAGRPIR